MLDEEDKKYFDNINFVFNDDIKFKKEFAKGFLDSFVKIYDTLSCIAAICSGVLPSLFCIFIFGLYLAYIL